MGMKKNFGPHVFAHHIIQKFPLDIRMCEAVCDNKFSQCINSCGHFEKYIY